MCCEQSMLHHGSVREPRAGVLPSLRRVLQKPSILRPVPTPADVVSLFDEVYPFFPHFSVLGDKLGGVIHCSPRPTGVSPRRQASCGKKYSVTQTVPSALYVTQLPGAPLCPRCDWTSAPVEWYSQHIVFTHPTVAEVAALRKELIQAAEDFPPSPSASDWKLLADLVEKNHLFNDDPIWSRLRESVSVAGEPFSFALKGASLHLLSLPLFSSAAHMDWRIYFNGHQSDPFPPGWSDQRVLTQGLSELGSKDFSSRWDKDFSSLGDLAPYLTLLHLWEVAPNYHLLPAPVYSLTRYMRMHSKDRVGISPGFDQAALDTALSLHRESSDLSLADVVDAALVLAD